MYLYSNITFYKVLFVILQKKNNILWHYFRVKLMGFFLSDKYPYHDVVVVNRGERVHYKGRKDIILSLYKVTRFIFMLKI